MTIQRVELTNVNSHRAFSLAIEPEASVVVIAGPNGSGKTTVANAIRIAMSGAPDRGITRKNELDRLITRGERDGYCAVTTGAGTYKINLRTGNYTSGTPPQIDPDILDPERWLALSPKDRIKSLFSLAGISLRPASIRADLVGQGHPADLVDAIMPSVSSGGLQAAAEKAKTLATESRGAWKAVTGENYGSAKAKTWKAELPPVDDTGDDTILSARRAQLSSQINALRERIGSIKAQRISAQRARDELATRMDAANAAGAALPGLIEQEGGLAEKLAGLEAAAKSSGHTTAPCPSCGTLLGVKGHELTIHDPSAMPAGGDALAAHKELPVARAALAAVRNKIDAAKRDITAAETLAEGAAGDIPDASDAERELAELTTMDGELAEQIAAIQQASRARLAAERSTASAAKHHADVESYSAIAAVLEEMPGKLIDQAIGAFRRDVAFASGAFAAPVTINDNCDVRYGDSDYEINASASQRWRCQMAVGYALARAAKTGVLVLDAFDLIQPADRGAILGKLAAMREGGVLVFVMATLKEPPKLPSPAFQTVWLTQENQP